MLTLNTADGMALLTMNRPAQRNAMSSELVRRMIEAFDTLDAAPEVRVVILTGAGNGFCAGSDLGGLAEMSAAQRRNFEAESGRLARLISALGKPVIAAVDGFAIGGGLTLAAACDLTVSQRDAKWSLPEVPIGLFPAWGLAAVVDRVGRPVAKRLSFGMEVLNGEEAHRLGLVDYLVETNSLARAYEIAARLAGLPAMQTGLVKEYFAHDPRDGETSDLLANRLFMRAALTGEAQAAFRKFASKK
ncbi:enoyl-CoA hydratase [Acidocella aquatica]|uniref:Enoyl-CoA hydratase n=1 Tax=Acidocella aquatica TaxID=1922313 RepID=A0ABQ6A6X1_9PROT|nr:enoyl-CoA hydratase/isomerase family protein [Acidocella aquatica]GLR68181.1 enoyl-CoA hydratase [Acidocella aquatica]